MLPFKKGAFHLAVQAQLPIVPIVCENYAALYSSKHKRFDGGEVTVRGELHLLLSFYCAVLTIVALQFYLQSRRLESPLLPKTLRS